MTDAMFERVKNSFVAAGLTTGWIVQLLFFEDSGKLTDSFIVFRPNGGTEIQNDLGADYYVSVDLVAAKDKRRLATEKAKELLKYVQDNPLADECLGMIHNMGNLPSPILTAEGRCVFRLQFSCVYGE